MQYVDAEGFICLFLILIWTVTLSFRVEIHWSNKKEATFLSFVTFLQNVFCIISAEIRVNREAKINLNICLCHSVRFLYCQWSSFITSQGFLFVQGLTFDVRHSPVGATMHRDFCQVCQESRKSLGCSLVMRECCSIPIKVLLLHRLCRGSHCFACLQQLPNSCHD